MFFGLISNQLVVYLENHVEEGEVLEYSAHLVSVRSQLQRHLNLTILLFPPCQPSLFTLTTFICQWQAYAKLSTPAAWVRGAPNFLIFLSTPDMFNVWPSSAFPGFFPGFRSLTGILLCPKYPRKFQECWQPCVWGLKVAGGIMRYRDLCTRRLSANRLYPMEPQSRARSPRNHNNIRTWVFFIGFLWLCAFSHRLTCEYVCARGKMKEGFIRLLCAVYNSWRADITSKEARFFMFESLLCYSTEKPKFLARSPTIDRVVS